MTRREVLERVAELYPDIPPAQLARMTSGAMPPDEVAIVIQSWADAGAVPGPDAWQVFLDVLRTSAEIAGYLVPIEGAVQGIVNLAKS